MSGEKSKCANDRDEIRVSRDGWKERKKKKKKNVESKMYLITFKHRDIDLTTNGSTLFCFYSSVSFVSIVDRWWRICFQTKTSWNRFGWRFADSFALLIYYQFILWYFIAFEGYMSMVACFRCQFQHWANHERIKWSIRIWDSFISKSSSIKIVLWMKMSTMKKKKKKTKTNKEKKEREREREKKKFEQSKQFQWLKKQPPQLISLYLYKFTYQKDENQIYYLVAVYMEFVQKRFYFFRQFFSGDMVFGHFLIVLPSTHTHTHNMKENKLLMLKCTWNQANSTYEHIYKMSRHLNTIQFH